MTFGNETTVRRFGLAFGSVLGVRSRVLSSSPASAAAAAAESEAEVEVEVEVETEAEAAECTDHGRVHNMKGGPPKWRPDVTGTTQEGEARQSKARQGTDAAQHTQRTQEDGGTTDRWTDGPKNVPVYPYAMNRGEIIQPFWNRR